MVSSPTNQPKIDVYLIFCGFAGTRLPGTSEFDFDFDFFLFFII